MRSGGTRSPRAWLALILLLAGGLAAAGCVAPGAELAPATEGGADALPPPLATGGATEAGVGDATLVADPTLPGPLEVTRLEYDFGQRPHLNTAQPSAYALPLRGSLHAPATGEGPFPLVLFQHGRHGTCVYLGTLEQLGNPVCPRAAPVVEPVDSYTGYDYIAQNLASHGYVVVSVDANAVNDRDNDYGRARTNRDAGAAARADLVLSTLDRLAQLHERSDGSAAGDAVEGRLDLERIGLMGHSRGGEGVTHAIHANLARPEAQRHGLRAVFALAPIDATRTSAPGVAFATLLPYCDGDVWSLAGARIFDASRRIEGDAFPKTQILVLGANHNYYNTVWTGDDAYWGHADPHCGTDDPAGPPPAGRLSAEDQRREGLAHIAAFFRLHLGGEAGYAPLFDGGATLPPGGCPGGVGECPGLVHVSHAPPPGTRRLVEDGAGDPATRNDLGGANAVSGALKARVCAAEDCDTDTHVAGSAGRIVLSWTHERGGDPARAAWTLAIPAEAADASAYSWLALRAAADPGSPRNVELASQDLRIVITDADGANASALASYHSRALFVPPGGSDFQHVVLNDVRIPLSAFAGVDLSRLASIALVFDQTPGGVLHVADVELRA